MGKGSTPRPYGVPKEQFNNNFDAIFRKKDKTPAPQEEPKSSEKKDAK